MTKAIDVLNELVKMPYWPGPYSLHEAPEFEGWSWFINSVDMYHQYKGGVDNGKVSLYTKTGKSITKDDWCRFKQD